MEKPYKKRFIWTAVTENLLINLLHEKTVQASGNRKKMHIFREMAHELHEDHGVTVTPLEIKMKINNLTTKYRKEKATMWTSGGKPSQWSHFPKLHQIIKDSQSNDNIDPLNVKEEDNNFQMDDDESISQQEEYSREQLASPVPSLPSRMSSTPSPMPARKSAAMKSRNFQKYLLIKFNKSYERMEQHMTAMQEADRQIIALEMEKVKLLRRQVSDGTELKNGVLKFLSEIEVVTSVT